MQALLPPPKVSVVIPTFDRNELLAQAVASALGQTYTDLEVIVVDDGSAEPAATRLAEQAEERLRVIRIKHTLVVGAVRNVGLNAARGELVAFLDDDDLWAPEKLAWQVRELDANLRLGLVCSNARVLTEPPLTDSSRFLALEQGKSGQVFEALLSDNFVIASSVVARRQHVVQAGAFSERPELRGFEDYDLWLRLAAESEVSYLEEPLVSYRRHSGSIMHGVSSAQSHEALVSMLDGLERALSPADSNRALVRRRRSELLVGLADARRVEGRRVGARRALATALLVEPRATGLAVSQRWARVARYRAGRIRDLVSSPKASRP